jgi:hypothetical protein
LQFAGAAEQKIGRFTLYTLNWRQALIVVPHTTQEHKPTKLGTAELVVESNPNCAHENEDEWTMLCL